MLSDTYERALHEFGREIGIPDLSFDKDGICHIIVNKSHPVSLRRDDAAGRLVLLGMIAERLSGDLPREMLEKYLATGLNSLRDGGCSVGIEPDSGMLMLHSSVYVGRLDIEYFKVILGEFLEKLTGFSESNSAFPVGSAA